MTPTQKAWIRLIALVFGTGCASCAAAYAGGAKVWVSVVIGLGVAGSNVYTALSPSPNDA